MTFYHVRIKRNNSPRWIFEYDLTKTQLEDKILSSFKKQQPFMCGTHVVRFSEIDSFGINETELSSIQILQKNRAKRVFEKIMSTDVRRNYLIDAEQVVYSGKDVTQEFIDELGLPEQSIPKLDSSKASALKKDQVFIVHGRDDRQALLLQKYLKEKLKVNAIIFDDLPDKGRTIIEQIEYIKNSVFYAFVIVTPDDVGCIRKDIEENAIKIQGLKNVPNETVAKILGLLHERARQNVVFELGLFIGALGRENVCCLKQKSVREEPSDIDGILYKEFDKEVKEIFHELSDEIIGKT
jgi:predicted nucleotide-binding protein